MHFQKDPYIFIHSSILQLWRNFCRHILTLSCMSWISGNMSTAMSTWSKIPTSVCHNFFHSQDESLVSCFVLMLNMHPQKNLKAMKTTNYLGLSPLPVRVTTRIITFLVGNPYKPSFPLLLGGGTTQQLPNNRNTTPQAARHTWTVPFHPTNSIQKSTSTKWSWRFPLTFKQNPVILLDASWIYTTNCPAEKMKQKTSKPIGRKKNTSQTKKSFWGLLFWTFLLVISSPISKISWKVPSIGGVFDVKLPVGLRSCDVMVKFTQKHPVNWMIPMILFMEEILLTTWDE